MAARQKGDSEGYGGRAKATSISLGANAQTSHHFSGSVCVYCGVGGCKVQGATGEGGEVGIELCTKNVFIGAY